MWRRDGSHQLPLRHGLHSDSPPCYCDITRSIIKLNLSIIRADLSQYYSAKMMFEQLLGRTAFMRVKDYGPLSAWCENYIKLLRALGVATEATVEIADAEWKQEVSDLLSHDCKRL